jgi:hypothetical protein
MTPCRECGREVSENAVACPQCGTPYPARAKWDGYGFEYRSDLTIGDLPLVHISFKYRANRTPVVARGVLAIGQFACGVVCVSQFGIGVICVSQFSIGVLVLAQFAAAYSLIAQFGLYVAEGHGQHIAQLGKLLGVL